MILTLLGKGFYIAFVDEGSFCLRWLVLLLFYELRLIIYAVFCLLGFYFALFSVWYFLGFETVFFKLFVL